MFLKATSARDSSSDFNFCSVHKLLLLLVVLFSASGIKAQHVGLFLFIHASFPLFVDIYVILNYSICVSFLHEQYFCIMVL